MSFFDIGKRFGRFVIIGFVTVRRGTKPYKCAEVKCDCGKIKTVRLSDLLRADGKTKSCGCLRKELAAQRNATHLATDTPLWKTWSTMVERCSRPNDDRYALRGITVCAEWREFLPFAEYMTKHLGPRPDNCTLDRIDNDKGYEPDNVRWATPTQQVRNREITRKTANNEPLATVAERSGISAATIDARLKRGWSIERATTEPARKYAETIAINGIQHTLGEWAKIRGISKAAVVKRIAEGWSLEDAVMTPKNGKYTLKPH